MEHETGANHSGARRVVLHPQTAAARQHDRARTFGGHVRGYTVDTAEVLALMSVQRRRAVSAFLVIMTPTLALPVILWALPGIGSFRPGGLPPLAWILMGPVLLASIIVVAFVHARHTNRYEDSWARRRAGRRL